MNINSITFQSIECPDIMAMFSHVSDNIEVSKKVGLDTLFEETKVAGWKPILAMTINIEDILKFEKKKVEPEVILSENWLLNTIIENKDKKLFEASKKYLPKYSKLLIKDTLLCKK